MKKLFYLGLALSVTLMSCGDDDPVEKTCEQRGDCPTSFIEASFEVDEGDVETITITDNGLGTGDYTMSKNKVYILDGFVFVNDGQTLTVEAGTIIKGGSGQGTSASALIIAAGGKIMAQGTATMPIVMTAEADKLARTNDGTLVEGGNLPITATGQWGGLIVLGKAGLNSNPGTTAIEGIPTTESRGIYGGTDDADNSGVIEYVSVRHGGTNIGSGNEINGITFGGVGSGTTVDYVEVVANADDGIEFFGGTVNVKHALCANVGDDSFDYDEGYRGKGQFWVSVTPGDRNGEHDGGTDPETAEPFATPEIYNATYIGGKSITFRDNAGGTYANSIFEDFSGSRAIDIEDLDEDAGTDSRDRYEAGVLTIKDNIFVNSGSTALLAYNLGKDDADNTIYGPLTADASNTSQTISLVSAANPVPAAAQSATAPSGSFFTAAAYKGAFDGTNWAQGWTLYYAN